MLHNNNKGTILVRIMKKPYSAPNRCELFLVVQPLTMAVCCIVFGLLVSNFLKPLHFCWSQYSLQSPLNDGLLNSSSFAITMYTCTFKYIAVHTLTHISLVAHMQEFYYEGVTRLTIENPCRIGSHIILSPNQYRGICMFDAFFCKQLHMRLRSRSNSKRVSLRVTYFHP